MQYLIIHEGKPFLTKWFDTENNYVQGMIVYDLYFWKWTNDGIFWAEIEQDHL